MPGWRFIRERGSNVIFEKQRIVEFQGEYTSYSEVCHVDVF